MCECVCVCVCVQKLLSVSMNLGIFQQIISTNTPYNQRKRLPHKDQQDL